MEHKNSDDRFVALEERFSGYEVHDAGGKVGEVNEVFVDEDGQPEYFGVRTGPSGARSPLVPLTRSTLIPLEAARVDKERRIVEVPRPPKGRVEDGPSYDDSREITPEFEQRVRSYYGLEGARYSEGHGASAGQHGADEESSSGSAQRSAEGFSSGPRDVDELRVQRSEEEARAGGTREREAGAVKVRKSVRTERERVRVPKRREEVGIERVPGEGREAPGAEIGDDHEEVVIQVLEEEVVVSKRIVVKEEIRLRKAVVEDEEVVEVDLRKEEVEIEDATGHGGAGRRADLLDDGTGRHEG